MSTDFTELRLWAEAHIQTGCTRSRQVLALLDRVAKLEQLTASLVDRVAKQAALLTQRAMKDVAHDATGTDRGTQRGADRGVPEPGLARSGDGIGEGVPAGSDGTTTGTGCGCDCADRTTEAEAGTATRFDGCTPLTSTVAGWKSRAEP